jgi:hypothetical protein
MKHVRLVFSTLKKKKKINDKIKNVTILTKNNIYIIIFFSFFD